MSEVPWDFGGKTPVAKLSWPENNNGLGHLRFQTPEPNRPWAVIPVSYEPSDKATAERGTNVWQITLVDEGLVEVNPSIHFIGHFHSPNPVRFKLVDEMAGDD